MRIVSHELSSCINEIYFASYCFVQTETIRVIFFYFQRQDEKTISEYLMSKKSQFYFISQYLRISVTVKRYFHVYIYIR